MQTLRLAVLILGVLLVMAGLTWVGQGSGYFPYPASSFMIDQSPWIWRGAGTALVGVVVMILSRRIV